MIKNDHMLSLHVLSTKYLCLYLLVSSIVAADDNTIGNNIILTLQLHEQDLDEYNCTVKESQIGHSKLVGDVVADDLKLLKAMHMDDDIKVPLPYDQDKQFFKIAFPDMCHYLQNVASDHDYDDEYQLPMPLLLDNPNDFYYDVTQLTNQEKVFMKEIESFDNANNNDNPFDIDMTRMDNLFKIAEFLQMERLLAIIGARQASLMAGMNRNELIGWLLANPNTEKQINDKDNNANQCDTSNNNEGLIPLLPQTLSGNDFDITNKQDGTIAHINDITKYNWALLTYIVPFWSCQDIHTFSLISTNFYDFANEWGQINKHIDLMIKILTNNNDATCLLLTNQELAFYQPFLALPQYKWGENQLDIFNQLKTMTNATINVDSNGFDFRTLVSLYDSYYLHTLRFRGYNNDDFEIRSRPQPQHLKRNNCSSISFKFGKFAQQVNIFAQSKSIQHIQIALSENTCLYLSSLNYLIGVNDIDNIKTISIDRHSLSFIDFEQIYNINYQLEYLDILNGRANQDTSVKNMQFLSKMDSLKELNLFNNNLDSFDFDALKGLTNLEEVHVCGNKFSYTLDTQCLDFSFLNNVPKLTTLELTTNQIECINNFMVLKNHPSLYSLRLQHNKISSLDLNVFQATNLTQIFLSHNKLSRFSHDDTSTLQQCLDFNSFNNMQRLQFLYLDNNQIQCIVNFESIQQHTHLWYLNLANNSLLSSIDFTKFDASKPLMNELEDIHFENMNLKYTKHNNACLDLQFLKFMPSLKRLYLSDNEIECIDNVSILQSNDIKLQYLNLQNVSLLSFDFIHLIGSNIGTILLNNNNLSPQSLKNFDANTLSQINPSGAVAIHIKHGNNVNLSLTKVHGVSIY